MVRRKWILFVPLFCSRAAHSQDVSCLLLQSSKACRAFQQYYVGVSGLSSSYSFLSNVTDVVSFDEALYTYVQSSADYLSQLGCRASNNDTQAPYARYSLTQLCSELINNAIYSQPCNWDHNITSEPVCQSTCESWISSIEAILSQDSSLCPNQATLNQSLISLETQCQTAVAYSTQCITGSDNEPDNCGKSMSLDALSYAARLTESNITGFLDQSAACDYCNSNSTDSCCGSVQGCNGLSAAAIAGIVVGSVAGAGLLGFAVFYFLCWRRKPQRKGGSGPFARYSQQQQQNPEQTSLMTDTAAAHPSEIMVPMTEKVEIPASSSSEEDEGAASQFEMVEYYCQSLLDFQPRSEDEIELRAGDFVYVIFRTQDGWGYGLNSRTNKIGLVPLSLLQRVDPSVLDPLLIHSLDPHPNDKTLIESPQDEQQEGGQEEISPDSTITTTSSRRNQQLVAIRMQQIRENVRRSISLTDLRRLSRLPRPAPPVYVQHHETVPHRAGSIERIRRSSKPTTPPEEPLLKGDLSSTYKQDY